LVGWNKIGFVNAVVILTTLPKVLTVVEDISVVTPCGLVGKENVSEEPSASFFRDEVIYCVFHFYDFLFGVFLFLATLRRTRIDFFIFYNCFPSHSEEVCLLPVP
jgi:hypothetical protein